MNAALQLLAMDGFVELYELDTTPLFTVNGTDTGGGTVYRWTSGIIEIRAEGSIPAGHTQTTTVITLDRVLPPAAATRSWSIST